MNDKEIFDLVLSNIEIFKEGLIEIKKSMVQDNGAKFSKQNTKHEDAYLRIENGVRIVPMFYKPINRFKFSVVNLEVIQHLLENGIPIYKIQGVSVKDYFCELKYLNYIIIPISS